MGRICSLVVVLVLTTLLGCNGSKKELTKGDSLGPPVIGDEGTRSDGADFGKIYTVTNIVEAVSDISSWANSDLPFTGPRRQLGQSFTDSQWPFEFSYSYPANNYKLNEAHLVIVTSRDSSDTEGIFVDGILTGRPPASLLSTTTTKVTHRYYACNGTCNGVLAPSTPSNTYFMDWALTHYKISTPNSFDLNIKDLLSPTTVEVKDIVNDGVLRIVTGDDSVVQTDTSTSSRPLLFLEGFTVSKTELTCSNSPTYKFINTYIHNDGNSVGSSFFSGSVLTPSDSWTNAQAAFRSVEFYYDQKLPRISSIDNIDLSKAELRVQIKRMASGDSAIIVNGVGVSQSGFDKTQATDQVEDWDTSTAAVSYWDSFMATVPNDNTSQTKTIDLISLLGESKIRELLGQGKLNVSIAGAIATVYGQGATTGRTYGVSVNGPELVLEGSYYTEVCTVPDDPTSPLSDDSGDVESCELDAASPITSSVQVVNITSTSATIQWLTNEPADSQVGYGISGTSANTTLDANMTTFHSVELTGLQPYKYYQYSVKTKDTCGNQTITAARTFRTLR